jgi:hypothetical protein
MYESARFTDAVYTRAMIDFSMDAGMATITLNRPEKLNAFAGTMREDFLAALRRAESDRACRRRHRKPSSGLRPPSPKGEGSQTRSLSLGRGCREAAGEGLR